MRMIPKVDPYIRPAVDFTSTGTMAIALLMATVGVTHAQSVMDERWDGHRNPWHGFQGDILPSGNIQFDHRLLEPVESSGDVRWHDNYINGHDFDAAGNGLLTDEPATIIKSDEVRNSDADTVKTLREQVTALQDLVEQLNARIKKLEQQLENPRNGDEQQISFD